MAVEDGLPPRERRRAIGVVLLAITMAVLDGTIVNLALPGIAQDLSASASQSIWVVNAYQLAVLTMLLPLATLGDRIGHRTIYLGGLALFTLASAGCAAASSLPVLAVVRVLQGLGAAGIMGVNAALVRRIYPATLLGRGIALNAMVVASATVAGPSIAAAILSVASWPWLFLVNLPLGLVTLWFGLRALPPDALLSANAPGQRGARPLKLLDVLLNIAMFALVFVAADLLGARGAPNAASTHAAADASAGSGSLWPGFALLVGGVLAGWVYVRRQLREPLPLLPLDLLRIPIFSLSICTSIAAFSAQMLAFIALPFLLLGPMGRSHAEAGLLITAWPLAIVLISPLSGRLIGRIPGGLLGAIGLALLCLGLALLAWLAPDASNTAIVWRMLLCGVGFGLFQSPNNHIIITSAPKHRTGAAGGMLGTARLTGQTLGAVMVASAFSLFGTGGGRGAFIALGCASAIAVLGALFSAGRLSPSAALRPHGH